MREKGYCIKLDDKVAGELETIARDTVGLPPEALIVMFVCRGIDPRHRLASVDIIKEDGDE